MNDSPDEQTDKLDDLMDRYVFGLLGGRQADRVRRKIESDPDWQLAYEAAVERERTLVAGVRAPGAGPGARAASAEQVLSAAKAREARWRSRRRTVRRVFLGVAAAAILLIIGMWVHVAMLGPPPYRLRLIGQRDLLAGSTASLRAIVTHRGDDGPAANVPVRLTLESTEDDGPEPIHVDWLSDDAGQATGEIRLPDWPDGRYRLVARAGGGNEPLLDVPITIRRASKLYLATDKPIYQPGQTIHMRCLALRKPSLKPFAGGKAELSVTDPAGNVIFSRTVTLSAYGLGWADLPLDDLVNPGRYDVKVAVGDDTSQQTVEIFRYELPAFSVKIDLDRPYYLPGQTITGTVAARYHFGKPVTGGQVELELTSRAVVVPDTLRKLILQTDAEGKAKLRIELPATLFGSARTAGDAHLLLSAQATDSAGQENIGYRTVAVGRQDIRIAAVAENGALNRGDKVEARVYIVTSYPDGRPARTIVDIESLARSIRTDDAGVAVLAARRIPDPLRISARDVGGRTGKLEISLPKARGEAMVLRTDRPVYNAGQTIHVEVLAPAAREVFLDVVKDRQTMLTRSLRVEDGRGKLALDLGGELAGTLRLHAYRLDDEGEWVGRDLLIVVRPARQLRVGVETDRNVFRPGRDAKLTFRVTDPAGRPTPAALSLSAVDEAVYSVQQAAPGFEQTLLGLDEELLRPAVEVHGLHPSLMRESAPYARALLAAATRRSLATPSRLKQLVEGGYLSGRVLEQSSMEAIRRALERHPQLASGVSSSLLAEVLSGVPGSHTHTLDRRDDRARDSLRRKRSAKTQAKIASGIALLAAVVGLLAWTLIDAAIAPKQPRRTTDGLRALACLLLGLFLLAVVLLPCATSALRSGYTAPGIVAMRSMADAEALAGMSRDIMFAPPPPDLPSAEAPGPARVRTYFPETLLWRPQVIAGADGRAVLTVPLADSITTWRLAGAAVSQAGQLGTIRSSVRVFQPFFVKVNAPQSLTQGDEVAVPLALHNYTAEPLSVSLKAEGSGGLVVVEVPDQQIRLAPGEPQRAFVRVKADRIGEAALVVTASAAGQADAMRRAIRIDPPGLPQSRVVNGQIASDREEVSLTIPADAVPGSVRVYLKLYPSTFSELLDGLEGIFRMPSGCFEQTCSTTYPNVMALAYMEAHGIGSAEVRAKARRYIHLGYQRLLSFEVPSGGFSWFGGPPARLSLTAYGLMQFADMAKVHRVDPAVLRRAARWLARQQESSGRWPGSLYRGPGGGGSSAELRTTAYVTWAMAHHDAGDRAARRGAEYVARNVGRARDAYTLALCANALLAAEGHVSAGRAALDSLAAMAKVAKDGLRYWSSGSETLMYGYGRSADIETTALAVLALSRDARHAALTQRALRWLVAARDGHGTWGTTQATVLSLKALLAGAGPPRRRSQEAEVRVTAAALKPIRGAGTAANTAAVAPSRGVGTAANTAAVAPGAKAEGARIRIPPEESHAVHTARLPALTKPGTYHLTMRSRNADGMAYQFVVRYHSVEAVEAPPGEPALGVKVDYDRTELRTGGTVKVRAVVTNRTDADARMLLVDIGTPPGFSVRPAGLDKLRERGKIERYTLTARGVIVYVDALRAGATLTIAYDMTARMPLRAVARPTTVYAYYDPDRRAAAKPTTFVVH